MLGELLADEIGLLSLFTIAFCIVMCIFFWRFFSKKMDEDARNQR